MTTTIHPLSRRSSSGTSTDQPWVQEGACRGNPDPWVENVGKKRKEWAKGQCLTECPVLEQCRRAGRGESHGIWAGVDHHGRSEGIDPRDPNRTVHGHASTGASVVRYARTGKFYIEPDKGDRFLVDVHTAAVFAFSGTYQLGLVGGTRFDGHIERLNKENA